MATFFCPQAGHCGEVQLYLKTPKILKLSCTFTWNFAQSSVPFFNSSGRREEQRFVLNRIVADLQVFISGSNIRGVADIKDIMATGKRSQVGRLVCEPLSVILSLVTCGILEKDLLTQAWKSFTCSRALAKMSSCWVYEISWQGINLQKTAIYRCSSPLGTLQGSGTSVTQRQKFHTDDDVNQCLHNKSCSAWVPNANFFNFVFLLVDFG